VNSDFLLRNELVYELTIRGVSIEGDISLFHIVKLFRLMLGEQAPTGLGNFG